MLFLAYPHMKGRPWLELTIPMAPVSSNVAGKSTIWCAEKITAITLHGSFGDVPATFDNTGDRVNQWIGLRENLQESLLIFMGTYMVSV